MPYIIASWIERQWKKNKLWYLCLLFLFLQIVIMAYHTDDAYYGYRMSWNLRHGNGFVYNPGERVNATTAPLWTLVTTVPYFVSGNIYYSSLLCCVAFSMAAIYIMQRRFARMGGSILLSTGILCFCTSFISYTTSGLENPLLFLLSGLTVVMFLTWDEYEAKQLIIIALVSSLLITTRMDNALIIFPLLVYAFLIKSKNKLKAIGSGVLGMLPFIAWELFSLIYYGFPFPNTAYMKLGTGFPLSYYLEKGVKYFTITIWNDPLVIVVPIAYIAGSFHKKSGKHIAVSLGILLYWVYLLYIGGDYMVGRHFTVTFFISVFCVLDLFGLSDLPLALEKPTYKTAKPIGLIIALCLVFQCLNINSPVNRLFPAYLQIKSVQDCRELFYPTTSIVGRYQQAKNRNIPKSEAEWLLWLPNQVSEIVKSGLKRDILDSDSVSGAMVYYHLAKNMYINDIHGLGDPLLARLPAINNNPRIGHMTREIPEGYRESIQNWDNEIKDPSLEKYYDILCLITRSNDLFAPERLEAIVKMNLKQYDYLLEEYVERNDTGRYE